MLKIFELKGEIQDYKWGGTQYISNLLGVESAGRKQAEYWLGAHQNAPSILLSPEGERPLDTYINQNLETILGTKIASEFGRLPFLFKVLDVHDMLSLQVHPTKSEAEKGFKLENEKGIPLTAPHRNYKDDNHKPEIMVALSEFWLLHGFLSESKLTDILRSVPEFTNLLPVFLNGGYFELYKKVMEQSQAECNSMLRPLIDRILPKYRMRELDKSSPDYWAAKAVETLMHDSNLDRGIYSIYFFNIVKADKGDAIFQNTGCPHAYLEGQNIELMANSDNVIRGGLTQKHIDVAELLKHVVYEETVPELLRGDLQDDGMERIYHSPAPDFDLSQIKLSGMKKYQNTSNTAEILMVIDGDVVINGGESTLSLNKGKAAFLTAELNYNISSSSSAVIYKATALSM